MSPKRWTTEADKGQSQNICQIQKIIGNHNFIDESVLKSFSNLSRDTCASSHPAPHVREPNDVTAEGTLSAT